MHTSLLFSQSSLSLAARFSKAVDAAEAEAAAAAPAAAPAEAPAEAPAVEVAGLKTVGFSSDMAA